MLQVHKIGNIYLGGPPLVKAATGEVVSGEELGKLTDRLRYAIFFAIVKHVLKDYWLTCHGSFFL